MFILGKELAYRVRSSQNDGICNFSNGLALTSSTWICDEENIPITDVCNWEFIQCDKSRPCDGSYCELDTFPISSITGISGIYCYQILLYLKNDYFLFF